MLFNSWQFGIFLPIVFAVYWSIPQRFRCFVILVSSYWFYMSWNIKYVTLILFTTIISFTSAILIERTDNQRTKKFILTSAVIACLGVLFTFKYVNFFSENLVYILNLFTIHLHPITLKLLLPVGISFYTFQTLGYVIDVYRGDTKAEKNFGIYAAFISFFPQLVAGPIERTNNLMPQIKAHHEFNYEQAVYGMKLMTWGFFKKLCIADVLAVYSDRVFNDVYSFKGFALILAAFFFTIQIYCDFSGYSDIARGCSKLFGIELMQNFRSPYFSSSIKEFWSRWHISLSTWFRDYVYIPLGGNRVSRFRHNVNLMITFIVSGLWHGANWTFVIWGSLHGFAQVIENAFMNHNETHGIKRAFRVVCVFVFCMFAWVFFRANNINEALYVFMNMFSGTINTAWFRNGFKYVYMNMRNLMHVSFCLIVLFIWDYLSLKRDIISRITSCRVPALRFAFCIGLISLVILFRTISNAVFVYFQF